MKKNIRDYMDSVYKNTDKDTKVRVAKLLINDIDVKYTNIIIKNKKAIREKNLNRIVIIQNCMPELCVLLTHNTNIEFIDALIDERIYQIDIDVQRLLVIYQLKLNKLDKSDKKILSKNILNIIEEFKKELKSDIEYNELFN